MRRESDRRNLNLIGIVLQGNIGDDEKALWLSNVRGSTIHILVLHNLIFGNLGMFSSSCEL